ncbi:MAG: tetratricopeptide repeat protein [Planctomycetes bacterium]|nr:tetratricopeptide repeat protein [Planctomycetota bacterium]
MSGVAASPAALAEEAAGLRAAGRLEGALGLADRALTLDPACAAALLERGVCLLLLGRHDDALAPLRALVDLSPEHALGLLNLGNALHGLGRSAEAADVYARAAAAAPASAVARNNLGRALQDLGRLDEAVARYDEALALDPGCGLALGNLRQALERLGRPGEMLARCEVACAARPDVHEARLHLAIALREAGRAHDALPHARAAADLDPESPAARLHLGLALQEAGRLDEALAAYEAALALDPAFAPALNCLAGAQSALGKVREAVATWTRAVEAAPGYHAAHGNRLLCMNYLPAPAEDLSLAHRAWGARVVAEVGPAPEDHDNDPDPDRRLRVGYLSPDLRAHPVASVLEPLLAGHDRDAVEVIAYDVWPGAKDGVTARLRGLVDGWRDVAWLDDAALAAAVRADRVDVLVDLAGHTGGNRLPVLARRPAPVQVTYLGYPNTTGLPTVDLRLTDATADPPGLADVLHTEGLARLPRCFLAWAPPDPSPAPAPLDDDDPRACTFGCFNNLSKVSPEAVALWARLLRDTPGARLLLKNHSLAHATARARAEGLFAAHGVTADRLVLTGRLGQAEHLALHDRVAVALDPFPYAGTVTTLEALWMGVPVVTLVGDRHASRVGASLLEAAGLRFLVARTPDEYVEVVRALLSDRARLRELKRGLRARLLASPLVDGDTLARAVEDAYRAGWGAWCASRRARVGPS